MYTIRFYSFLMHNSPIIYNDQRPSVHPFLYHIDLVKQHLSRFSRESGSILSEDKHNVKHFFKLFLIFFQKVVFCLFFNSLNVFFI